MATQQNDPQEGEVIEALTLVDLCRAGGFHAEWVIDLVDYGVLEPRGAETASWLFSTPSLSIAERAWRMHRDLGVNLPGIALVIGLIAERDHLKRRLAWVDRIEVGPTRREEK